MRSLARIWDLARKEVLESASTPFLFLVTTIFLFLSGHFFYSGALYYSQLSAEWLANPSLQRTALNVSNLLLPPLFSNYSLLLLFFVPLLTMASFSSEKRNGTLELLFTLPIRDAEIVLGKWLGTVLILLVLLCPLWIHPFVYRMMGGPMALDTYASGFLSLLLLACLFSAIGLFVSSLLESQTASAILTTGILILLWTWENIQSFSFRGVGEDIVKFSVQKYFQPFLRGLISTEGILFFLFGIVFFLFLTLRSLEKRSFRNPL